MNRLLVIIPAYNEASNIADVVLRVQKATDALSNIRATVLVVNDGSTDSTSDCARATDAVVLDLPYNLGIGGAVQCGFRYARDKKFDMAIQIDGDGQHDPSFIHKLLSPLQEGTADMVIGSRFLNREGFQSTWLRRVGIRIFEWVNSAIIGQRITDNTSGFRAYNKQAIALLAEEYPSDYPEPEAVIVLGLRGFKICETPVVMRERQGGTSSIGSMSSVYYMAKVLLAIGVNVFKKQNQR